MKSSELRIGNLINAPFYDEPIEIHSVCSVSEDIFNRTTGEIPIDTISPIPLTEEWLIKLEFEKLYETPLSVIYDYKKNNLFDYRLSKNGELSNKGLRWKSIDIPSCEYVHQLQNLYHALTGEELTMTQQ